MDREPTELELRVAKAITNARMSYHTIDGRFNMLEVEMARAAIRAMREPTRDMHEAGEEAAFLRRRQERKSVDEIRARTGGLPAWESTDAIAAWQAMIDTASPPMEK